MNATSYLPSGDTCGESLIPNVTFLVRAGAQQPDAIATNAAEFSSFRISSTLRISNISSDSDNSDGCCGPCRFAAMMPTRASNSL
jgi:hypothetical protein